MDLKMPEECDTVYPHRKETGNRTDGFGCTVRSALVIGDLDHDEYDSINPVLLNASA